MACSSILTGVALLPFYDRNAMGVPGYSPVPWAVSSQAECMELCDRLLYDCEA